MEGISGSMRKGLKEYWRRWGYRRLNGSGGRRRNTVELGGSTGTRRRRWWRIKLSRKIMIPRIPSPKKLTLWLRDAYVRMMLRLVNSRVMNMRASATGYGGMALGGFGRAPPPKEYDDKMLIHMYRSLMMAQGQTVGAPRCTTYNDLRNRLPTTMRQEWCDHVLK